MKKPIVVSFCSGSLGLDIGLERAGFETVLASEIDRDAVNTIRANRPHLRVIGDLRHYTAAQVRAAARIGNKDIIDLVVGGPPCQSFSTAGKHQGLDDPRGQVLLKFVELAIELGPRYVVVENVRGLMLNSAFDRVLGMFGDADYVVSWNLYDAAYFGVPQRRERVIIVASRDGRVPHLTPTHSNRPEDGLPSWRTLRDVIWDLREIEHHHARYPAWRLKFFKELKEGQNWKDLRHPEQAITERVRKATGGKSEFYRRLAWDKPANTLLTNPCNTLSGCCHPEQHRPLSVEEYANLQGLPADWQVCGSLASQYRQIANAVPVPLGEAVGKTILRHLRTGCSSEERPGFKFSRYRTDNDLDRTLKEQDRNDALAQVDRLCEEFGIPPAPPATRIRP
jgi:DNA (cytosine-5)-methyltransferase 1